MQHRSRTVAHSHAGLLFAAVAAVMCMLLPINFWLRLLCGELVLIWAATDLLTQYLPPKLLSASRANYYRIDGSCSHRRRALEQRALTKIRSNMWAAFLVVGFVSTGSLAAIHEYVFPLPLASNVVAAAVDRSSDFKTALRAQRVDREFFQWSRSGSRRSNAQIDQQMEQLWLAWPALGLLSVVGLVGSAALVRYTYLRSLSEFQAGVAQRSTVYLNLDTARLQDMETSSRA